MASLLLGLALADLTLRMGRTLFFNILLLVFCSTNLYSESDRKDTSDKAANTSMMGAAMAMMSCMQLMKAAREAVDPTEKALLRSMAMQQCQQGMENMNAGKGNKKNADNIASTDIPKYDSFTKPSPASVPTPGSGSDSLVTGFKSGDDSKSKSDDGITVPSPSIPDGPSTPGQTASNTNGISTDPVSLTARTLSPGSGKIEEDKTSPKTNAIPNIPGQNTGSSNNPFAVGTTGLNPNGSLAYNPPSANGSGTSSNRDLASTSTSGKETGKTSGRQKATSNGEASGAGGGGGDGSKGNGSGGSSDDDFLSGLMAKMMGPPAGAEAGLEGLAGGEDLAKLTGENQRMNIFEFASVQYQDLASQKKISRQSSLK